VGTDCFFPAEQEGVLQEAGNAYRDAENAFNGRKGEGSIPTASTILTALLPLRAVKLNGSLTAPPVTSVRRNAGREEDLRLETIKRSRQSRGRAMAVIARSQNAREKATLAVAHWHRANAHAVSLLNDTREAILTFAVVRSRSISGGTDDTDGRDKLRMVLSAGPFMLWIAPSVGTACAVCGRWITEGETQYVAQTDYTELHLDRSCFRSLIDDPRTKRWGRREDHTS